MKSNHSKSAQVFHYKALYIAFGSKTITVRKYLVKNIYNYYIIVLTGFHLIDRLKKTQKGTIEKGWFDPKGQTNPLEKGWSPKQELEVCLCSRLQ